MTAAQAAFGHLLPTPRELAAKVATSVKPIADNRWAFLGAFLIALSVIAIFAMNSRTWGPVFKWFLVTLILGTLIYQWENLKYFWERGFGS